MAIKLPRGIVDAMKRSLVSEYGPRALRHMLEAYDRKEITAENLIESLRATLEALEAGADFISEKGPGR